MKQMKNKCNPWATSLNYSSINCKFFKKKETKWQPQPNYLRENPTKLPLEFGPKHGYWEKTHLSCNFNRRKRIKWWPQVPQGNMVAKGKWAKVEPLRNLGPKHGFMGQMGPSFLQNYPFAWGNMFM
jgi:hypothetical protein